MIATVLESEMERWFGPLVFSRQFTVPAAKWLNRMSFVKDIGDLFTQIFSILSQSCKYFSAQQLLRI